MDNELLVTTSKYEYQGLYRETRTSKYSYDPVKELWSFQHNGKVWKLNESECTILRYVDLNTHKEQYTGGSSDYYKVFVKNPTTLSDPYEAECADIIEALKLDFAEGNILKAVWRRAVARNSGIKKRGYDDGKYDAEKIKWFADIIANRYTS